MSAASGGNSEPKQRQRSQSARGFCPRSTMRVPQPDIIEHFGNADAVRQPPERCLSRKAGIVRYCLRNPPVLLSIQNDFSRTIPALRLKHRSGSCGTATALPKCSIMSGCGTRIVLRGQKPLALCDRCPCFGSLFPPLAALTFAASSIICAFGLASAAPRSPYRHLELCGIALKNICMGRCSASSHTQGLAGIISSPPKDCKQKPAPFQEPVNI